MKMTLLYLFFLIGITSVNGQQQLSIFFESDAFIPNNTQQANLEKWVSENKEAKIVGVHGFCDEDGTSGYNDTLAKKRIDAVLKRINNRIKIREDFKSRSFGELHALSANKAENRKVTLYYIEPKDFPREAEILGIKKDVVAKPKTVKRFPEKISINNPNGTISEYKLDTNFMRKVDEAKAGEKLKVENLNFLVNTFAVMPESRGKMYELLLVMENNPTLKIDIQGHLCCMPNDRLDLSTQRAKAIYNFLVGNKISKSRLSFQGFGSTIPIYALPEKSETERAANRRVEIMIVEN